MAKTKLDFDKLAQGLGAQRRGRVEAGAGYFAAAQFAAELALRLRVPANGGRPTDPTWTERRIVPLRQLTLQRLNADAGRLRVEPMQLAALLIEKGLERLEEEFPDRAGSGRSETPGAKRTLGQQAGR